MSAAPAFVTLQNDQVSLIFSNQGRVPTLLYYGKKLSDTTSAQMLATLSTRQEAKCAPVTEPPVALVPTHGEGFTGAPGLEVFGDTDQWAAGFFLQNIEHNAQQAVFTLSDDTRGLLLTLTVTLDSNTSVATFTSSIKNTGQTAINLSYLNAATLSLPMHFTSIRGFEGRWSNEFQTQDHDLFMGSYVRENRRGKTSHDTFPGLLAYARGTAELHGECMGFHLGASANHRLRAEMMADGRSYVQFGELLLPGEVSLASGQSYTSPVLYAGFAQDGFSALSRQFHEYIRVNILRHSAQSKPRPVHYNTWEGIYFDHDETTLKALADEVAPLGVERFVLDDGWFKGRRHDHAGLGDWTVDEAIYPQGLDSLIDYVTDKGMEFGIWFEPEMVNPDSDLYRAHPEWALQTKNNPHIPFRHQYVLDLTNPDVTDYLFKVIDDVMTAYPKITYIKWDMNRDVNHPGNLAGKPAMHGQMSALYALIDRVRAAHPQLEIESCCSGGGRVDLGILPHTDRFWTSDSNDALDRLYIQRGFSFFFPSEVMGAHVGPRDCHITGRHLPIELRSAVAMFGHMGIEMDPRELTDHEKEVLKTAINLYKENRSLLHSGDLFRMDDDGLNVKFGYVAKDKSKGIFAYNNVKETGRTIPSRFYFAGLNPEQQYRLNRAELGNLKEYSPSILQKTDGEIFSGEALMTFGMQMPVLFPQTSLIYTVEAV
ncbi:alpha-galactosidase [Salinimonas lutimaris]|uniref:alpha-galactosidase n=1 Tax=Salinimonas lutimaris TaxID=914153 RepID=UPI0010C01C1C|nr:alpha-galactosidase [Salinimonas lutimaris]